MKRLCLFFFALAAAPSLGCSGEPAPPPEPEPDCDVVVDWGHEGDGGFVPFADADEAEITLGFQGFRYIISMVEIGSDADTAQLSFRIDVDGQDAYSQSETADTVPAPEGGVRHAVDVLVFFNDLPLAQVIGQQARVSLDVEAGGCRGHDEHSVVLVDEEDCVDSSDGGQECDGDASL